MHAVLYEVNFIQGRFFLFYYFSYMALKAKAYFTLIEYSCSKINANVERINKVKSHMEIQRNSRCDQRITADSPPNTSSTSNVPKQHKYLNCLNSIF